MKALSLWQPWASLLLHPSEVYRKHFETRGWPCPPSLIGKPLAIHATKTIRRDVLDMFEFELTDEERGFFDEAFSDAGWTLKTLPLGAVLGIVRVVECRPTSQVNPTSIEAAFGDFGPGRYAWRMEVVERFAVPIPAKGMQGIWEWDDAAKAGAA